MGIGRAFVRRGKFPKSMTCWRGIILLVILRNILVILNRFLFGGIICFRNLTRLPTTRILGLPLPVKSWLSGTCLIVNGRRRLIWRMVGRMLILIGLIVIRPFRLFFGHLLCRPRSQCRAFRRLVRVKKFSRILLVGLTRLYSPYRIPPLIMGRPTLVSGWVPCLMLERKRRLLWRKFLFIVVGRFGWRVKCFVWRLMFRWLIRLCLVLVGPRMSIR